MTSIFIKRLQKFFLHLLKLQKKYTHANTVLKEGPFCTLDKGTTFSGDPGAIAVSDSDDDVGTEALSRKSSSFSTGLRKGPSLDESGIDDDRSPPSSEKLKSTITFYRTVAPISREEIGSMMRKSGSDGSEQ